jgi:hypothetical protein
MRTVDAALTDDECAFFDRVLATMRASARNRAGIGKPSRKRTGKPSRKKSEFDWAAWASAQMMGAVRGVATELILEEMRRNPPDPPTLAEAADLLEEILSDAMKVPTPQQRRECRRFIARLIQEDVDMLADTLRRRGVPNSVEQALQTVAKERGVKAKKADAFTENPEGKALAKWLQHNR